MKLKCSLVEDIYPLYEENELKPENRHAVEEHLKTCSNCSELYKNGIGFSDLPFSIDEENLSKEADDRIRLRFKLRRMKVIAAIMATVMIVSGINQYANNREKVADLLDGVYLYGESINEIVKNPYELDKNGEIMSYSAEDITNLDSELNWIEKRRHKGPLIINSQDLDEMSSILRERKSQGLEDATDHLAIEQLQKHANTLFHVIQKEYNEFHHGYSSYFEILDVEGISEPIRRINELTYFYNRYQKLPSQMKVMEERTLKENISKVFHTKDITLEKTKPINENFGVYHFEINKDNTQIEGEIDGYTGLIISADNISHRQNEKKPINIDVVRKKADKILKEMYGKQTHFEITIDNRDAEPNIYRFSYVPLLKEYRLIQPMGLNFSIEFDAGTGEFYHLSTKPAMQSKAFFQKSYKESLSQQSIADKASEITGKKANAIRKGIIYSPISADYILVYIFEGKDNWVYINAENGIVERPYTPMH